MARPRIHKTEEERKAAQKASRDKRRAKPGVREMELEQCRQRSKLRREEKTKEGRQISVLRAELALNLQSARPTSFSEPQVLLQSLRYFLTAINPTEFPKALEYSRCEKDGDIDWIRDSFEPSVEGFLVGSSTSKRASLYSVCDSGRLVGRLARKEITAAERRYEEVINISGSGADVNVVLVRWQEQVDYALVVRQRWAIFHEVCAASDSAYNKVFLLMYHWLSLKLYFLAEAIVNLQGGLEFFKSGWEDGDTFKATETYLFSEFLTLG